MTPATRPRAEPLDERLLFLDPMTDQIADMQLRDLPSLLEPGDTLVVNDAATLPASFHTRDGTVEARLVAKRDRDTDWLLLLFGAGDFRTPTEARPEPPPLGAGDRLVFGEGLSATILAVDASSARLVDVRFDRDGAELWRAFYVHGKPVQYSYLSFALELFHVQNRFAARPWALELPSGGRPLTWSLISALRRHRVDLAFVTHAAGLSSTGSIALDRRFPLPERYLVSEAACEAVRTTKARGGRVVAVGTTVVRALEACALDNGGKLVPSEAVATIILGPGFRPLVVDGLLTGMHEQGTSHFALMEAFAPRLLLERAMNHARETGYLAHEFGDSCFVLPRQGSIEHRVCP